MFPGVEGQPWSLEWAHDALRDAGIDSAIRIFEWQRIGGSLANLTDLPGNREKAAAVAADIQRFRAARPEAPIDLIGYSGGAGIALFVAEALADSPVAPPVTADPAARPADSMAKPESDAGMPAPVEEPAKSDRPPREPILRNVVLVHPAVSPDYDLTSALRATRGRIINFYSPRDWFILGLGTTAFGTVDRKFVASAGKTGFDAARAVPEPAQRHRLVQVAWTREMAADGHGGDHLGGLWRSWNRKHVAPQLK